MDGARGQQSREAKWINKRGDNVRGGQATGETGGEGSNSQPQSQRSGSGKGQSWPANFEAVLDGESNGERDATVEGGGGNQRMADEDTRSAAPRESRGHPTRRTRRRRRGIIEDAQRMQQVHPMYWGVVEYVWSNP